MKTCFRCKRLLATGVLECPGCGSTSFYSADIITQEAVRPKLVPAVGLFWCFLCLMPALVYIMREGHAVQELRKKAADERAPRALSHAETALVQGAKLKQQLREMEQDFEKRLSNVELISGALAERKHQEEWRQRLAQEPRYARSAAELKLVEVARLGREQSMSAEEALEKAALLVSPPGSRAEVSAENRRYHVRVAFHLSALGEEATTSQVQNTDTMRREIQRLSAQIIKDLYATCGWRGIERVSVSCNSAMQQSFAPKNADPLELEQFRRRARVVMGSVYRVSAEAGALMGVGEWKAASLWKVMPLMKVEKDGLVDLRLSKDLVRLRASEPHSNLEF